MSESKQIFDTEKSSYYLADFSELDLSGQDLQGFEFEACTFSRSDFTSATLSGFRFIDCTFTDCNFNHAKLPSTRMRGSIFERCKLMEVNWTLLEWSRLMTTAELTFRDCVLSDGVFFGLLLDEVIMQSCKAHRADFRESSLRRADLTFTDFTDAKFGRSNLTDADFCEATAFNIDVLNNEMKGSKFSRFEAARLLFGLDIEVVD